MKNLNSFFINSNVWGFDPFNKLATSIRGHKYHILPTNSSPFTVSMATLLFLATFVWNLHTNYVSVPCLDSFFFAELKNFYTLICVSNISFLICSITDTNFLVLDELSNINFKNTYLYINWFSPYFIVLGLFFLWNTNAIEEGITSKISSVRFNFKNAPISTERLTLNSLYHTNLVRKGFKIGFILFIVSEVMFFFGFFWAFFHSALSPTIQIGAVWPPIGVDFITVKGFAVANTVILLTSGATLTIAHYAFELIPLRRVFLKKQDLDWNENEEFYKKKELFTWGIVAFPLAPGHVYYWLFFRFDYPEHYYTKIYLFRNSFKTHLLRLNPLKDSFERYSLYLPSYFMMGPDCTYFLYDRYLLSTEIKVLRYIKSMLTSTLALALLFMLFQCIEYFISPVNIDTGVYGSTFYMITGLHGFHVFIGTCFLFYCRCAVLLDKNSTIFINNYEIIFNGIIKSFEKFKKGSYIDVDLTLLSKYATCKTWFYGKHGIESFECAAWYWHFVDVVWIFVFAFVYVWSHLTVLDKM